MAFFCHGCGECCRHLAAALTQAGTLPAGTVLHEAAAAFPHAVQADGSCSQLLADNRCGCYATRPLLCDIDRLFAALALDMSREQWHLLNAAACPPPR